MSQYKAIDEFFKRKETAVDHIILSWCGGDLRSTNDELLRQIREDGWLIDFEDAYGDLFDFEILDRFDALRSNHE